MEKKETNKAKNMRNQNLEDINSKSPRILNSKKDKSFHGG